MSQPRRTRPGKNAEPHPDLAFYHAAVTHTGVDPTAKTDATWRNAIQFPTPARPAAQPRKGVQP